LDIGAFRQVEYALNETIRWVLSIGLPLDEIVLTTAPVMEYQIPEEPGRIFHVEENICLGDQS
jgi:hypothetical protein